MMVWRYQRYVSVYIRALRREVKLFISIAYNNIIIYTVILLAL